MDSNLKNGFIVAFLLIILPYLFAIVVGLAVCLYMYSLK